MLAPEEDLRMYAQVEERVRETETRRRQELDVAQSQIRGAWSIAVIACILYSHAEPAATMCSRLSSLCLCPLLMQPYHRR